MDAEQLLYKYRSYSARSLEILIKQELYFASPAQLNDPFDCQLSIQGAITVALKEAELAANQVSRVILAKMSECLPHIWSQMERDIKSVGVLSLTTDTPKTKHSLMWAHYADEHRGFRLGFKFAEDWSSYQRGYSLIGRAPVDYESSNPYVRKFLEIAKSSDVPDFHQFAMQMLEIGVCAKAHDWEHEGEVRVLRKGSAVVPFDPSDLVEVVIGARMDQSQEDTIWQLMNDSIWSHVQRKRAISRRDHQFGMDIIDI